MESLKETVLSYTSCQTNTDGAVRTPVNGFMMKCLYKPSGDLYAMHRPAVFLILQGTKRMTAGKEECAVAEGQSVIVSAHIPVVSRIVQASRDEPYLAVRIELEITVLRELAAQLGRHRPNHTAHTRALLSGETEAATLDCATRLIRLINFPAAIPLLRSGIIRELHYWLLTGKHAASMRALADPHRHASNVGAAIEIIQREYRRHIPVERLAEAASMSLSAFHLHFRRLTSLTPGQYQKRLRLVQARRLMMEEGNSASSAAFAVGYQSVSQFTREYARLFDAPPKRDVLRGHESGEAQNPLHDGAVAQFAGASTAIVRQVSPITEDLGREVTPLSQ